MNAWVNGVVVKQSVGGEMVGPLLAVTSIVACAASALAGLYTNRSGPGFYGKDAAMYFGNAMFFVLALLVWVSEEATLGTWGMLVPLFVLQGLGRGIFESTNKGVIADFFPGPKAAAGFANFVVLSGGSSFMMFFFMNPVIKGGTCAISSCGGERFTASCATGATCSPDDFCMNGTMLKCACVPPPTPDDGGGGKPLSPAAAAAAAAKFPEWVPTFADDGKVWLTILATHPAIRPSHEASQSRRTHSGPHACVCLSLSHLLPRSLTLSLPPSACSVFFWQDVFAGICLVFGVLAAVCYTVAQKLHKTETKGGAAAAGAGGGSGGMSEGLTAGQATSEAS